MPGLGQDDLRGPFNPLEGWVHLTLDDLRQALWPPHRQVYWQVRMGTYDREAQEVLHRTGEAAVEAALSAGFSLVMADTHLTRAVFKRELAIVALHGITIEWKLFDVSWDALIARNEARGFEDPTHRVSDAVLRIAYDALWAANAWWRSLPSDQLEIIRPSILCRRRAGEANSRLLKFLQSMVGWLQIRWA